MSAQAKSKPNAAGLDNVTDLIVRPETFTPFILNFHSKLNKIGMVYNVPFPNVSKKLTTIARLKK
jgi:hypothetical protein